MTINTVVKKEKHSVMHTKLLILTHIKMKEELA